MEVSQQHEQTCGFSLGVVVFEISPTYYAANQPFGRVEIRGIGFDALPNNIEGVLSEINEAPTEYAEALPAWVVCTLVSKTDTLMVFSNGNRDGALDRYMGCIIQSETREILWVNDTKPLPRG